MLLPTPPQFRKRRGPKKSTNTAPPGPTPLTLVSAFYTPGDPGFLTLQFDRAIDPTGYINEAFLLNDGQFAHQYFTPGGYGMIDAQTIEFDLNPLEPTSGTDVRLNVTEGNGIVAVDDAQPWPGCTNLLLPFP